MVWSGVKTSILGLGFINYSDKYGPTNVFQTVFYYILRSFWLLRCNLSNDNLYQYSLWGTSFRWTHSHNFSSMKIYENKLNKDGLTAFERPCLEMAAWYLAIFSLRDGASCPLTDTVIPRTTGASQRYTMHFSLALRRYWVRSPMSTNYCGKMAPSRVSESTLESHLG